MVCALITVNFRAISRGPLKPAAFLCHLLDERQPAGSHTRGLLFYGARKMDNTVLIGLKELHCSEFYLREREVRKAMMTCRLWVPETTTPVKICRDHGFDCWVIAEGLATAYAAWQLGLKSIAVLVCDQTFPKYETVIKGFRETLAKGVRGIVDLQPYNILDEDRWHDLQGQYKSIPELVWKAA